MAKVKLTKDELRRQKDELARFTRFLPLVELKIKQLQLEVHKVQIAIKQLQEEIARSVAEVGQWAGVFTAEIDLRELFRIGNVSIERENVAGIDIPVLGEVEFEDLPCDLFATPLWVDAGVQACKEQVRRQAGLRIAEKQRDILQEELRITIQRLNLFKKVKVPQARRNIRTIQIFLGDQQTAAVVRGKIAKGNIEKKNKQGMGRR